MWRPAQRLITGAHFNNEQIMAEIEGILWDVRTAAEPEMSTVLVSNQ